MRERHKSKMSRKQRRIKNRVTLRTLFLLAITLIFNTYAWFMYATTVSTNMSARVEAWKVEFEVDNHTISRVFNIYIEHAYPGMPDQVKSVVIRNRGDKVADIEYAIKSVRVFDERYMAADLLDSGETIPSGTTSSTSSALLSKMQNDYPFHLDFTLNSGTLAVGQMTTMTLTFDWPYESGDDNTDTSYGTAAYTYNQLNPNSYPIEIFIKLTVYQHET